MRLMPKFALAVTVPLGVVALVLVLLFRESIDERAVLAGAVARLREANERVAALNQLLVRESRLVLRLHVDAAARDLREIEQARAAFAAGFDGLAQLELGDEGRRLLRRLVEAREGTAELELALAEVVRTGDAAAIATAYRLWELKLERIEAALADLTVYAAKHTMRGLDDAWTRRERARRALFGMLLLAGVILAALGVHVGRSFVGPVVAMTAVARSIARSGRLPPEASLGAAGQGRADEVGALAASLEAMARRLEDSNAELRAAVAARDEFLSVASHELKTPLTAMKLVLETERNAARRAGEAESRGRTILLRQLARLTRLVDDLLDVARVRGGKLSLSLQDVDLSALAREVAARHETELANAGCTLTIDAAEGVTGPWDPFRLEQVLTNLLTNAARYAPGTPVELTVRATESGAELRVRDHGPGLPAADRERAFDRFERLGGDPNIAGLGLGLFVSRQIARLHGGELHVEEAAGGGCNFVLRLPGAASAPPVVTGRAS